MLPKLAVSAVAVLFLGGCLKDESPGGPEEEGDEWSFMVYHFDSRFTDLPPGAQPGEAQEIFRVYQVDSDFAPAVANLTFTDNGQPRSVNWQDVDGVLGVEDRLWFFAEPEDVRHELEGWMGSTKVMHCAYGGGAGQPFEPDELERAGILKCVETPQD